MLLKPPVTPTLVADIIRLHDCPYATLTLDTPHEARGTIRAEVIRSCIDEYPLRLVLTPSRMWGRLFVTGLIDEDDLPSNPDVWSSMALEAAITYRSWCDVGIDPRTGAATLRIGKAEAVLPRSEQVGTEQLTEGGHIRVYVVDVRETERGPRAIISRTHPDLVKRLFETEVPEIYDGTVEIKAVSREAGSRTKLAVVSHNPDVDAIGACIGARGSRVSSIVEELGGEKIDIVEYNEDPAKFIASALSPATVIGVTVAADGSHACRVTVPDSQLSLAIGNKGQNARLAAKLTGWKIDIKPESGFYGEEEPAAPAETAPAAEQETEAAPEAPAEND